MTHIAERSNHIFKQYKIYFVPVLLKLSIMLISKVINMLKFIFTTFLKNI